MATASDEGNKQRAIIALQAALPEDLIRHILSFLSLSSLLSFQLTCKSLHDISNRPSFWETKFRELVKTKMFIPRNTMATFKSNPKESFKTAYQDRFRTTIEKEELVGRVWYFWIKRSAGEEWTCWDPFWVTKGTDCRKMVFLEDGSVLECPSNPARNRNSTQAQPRTTSTEYGYCSSAAVASVSALHSVVLDDVPSSATGAKRFRVDDVVNGGSPRKNAWCHQQVELRKGLTANNNDDDANVLGEHSSSQCSRRSSLDDNSIIPLEVSNDDEVGTGSDTSGSAIDPAILRPVFYNEPNVPNNIVMKWRFITHPLDFRPREKPQGYIRLVVGGREVPTYVVRRLSNDNWGFILESCWGVFSSFNITRNGIHVNNGDKYMKSFREDSKWNTLTTAIQWKEAMLYNNGANTLPEGNR